MTTRERLSATVEAGTLAAARLAVRDGRAPNVSAWVNEALHRQADHDRRMKALDEFLAAYEAEHGEISESEVRDAARRAASRAVIVRPPVAERGSGPGPKKRPKKRVKKRAG